VSLIGVASPAYLAEHGTPQSLAELRQHRCLMGFDREERAQTHWAPAGHKLSLTGAAFSNDPHLLLRFVERGLGIAFLPATVVAPKIARGELTPVLPKRLRLEGSISIVYAERKLMPPAVRAFIDWVIDRGPIALGNASLKA
jgi:DNA-binding transcriptional LysR family regulator